MLPLPDVATRMRLSQADFDALQAAILDLYSCRDPEVFKRTAPRIVLRIVPARHVLFIDSRVDPASRRAMVVDLWESFPRLLPELAVRMRRAVLGRPIGGCTAERADSGAFRLVDFFTMREFHDAEIHDEFHRRAGIPRRLGVTWLSGSGLATLQAIRPPSEPPFTRRDHRLLDLLAPHFDLARRNAEWVATRRGECSGSLESLQLTARELEVARQLALGRANPEIALALRVRPRTVEKHVESILAKLGVENRTAAAIVIAEAEKA